MDMKQLEIAKKELREATARMDYFSMARIIDAPIDPRKPVADIITKVANIIPAATPGEDLFYYDVIEDVKTVYALATDGTVTAIAVTPSTPSAVSFIKTQSPVYNIQIVDLNSAKFDIIGKKKKAISNSLDCKEVYDIINLLIAGATGAGNAFTLDTAKTFLDFPKILELLNSISSYGDKYVLITGANCDNDIVLTDYNENKNQSVLAMLDRLGIEKIKLTGKITINGTVSDIIDPNKAILVATSTLAGKPVDFGRKKLVPGLAINGNSDAKLRLSVVIPVIPKGGESPSVGLWGYGEIAAVVTNSKALATFDRV